MPASSATPSFRHGSLWLAMITAIGLRAIVLLATNVPPSGLETGYIFTAGCLASGQGMLMPSAATCKDAPDVVEVMQAMQARGERLSPSHPLLTSTDGWLPNTRHPAGYTILLYLLYLIGNYSGMIVGAHVLQILADSSVCVLLFLFCRNLFGPRIGVWSSWLYAVLPPAVVLSSCWLLPDTMYRFFPALILCLASYALLRRRWMMLLVGAVIGLACNFRPDFLMFPGVIFVLLWANTRRLKDGVAGTLMTAAGMMLVMLPWVIWTRSVTGRAMLGTSASGGSMYEALGIIRPNPWGMTINNDDDYSEEAVARGFKSAWSSDASAYYGDRFWKCVADAPLFYLNVVLRHRLPMALVPPYELRRSLEATDQISFTKFRREEGLSHWGVVRKYPGLVIRVYWFSVLMIGLSSVLLLGLVHSSIAHRREWRKMAWLVLPWAYTVGSISLVKQIESRNVSPILVVQVVALALMLTHIIDAWRGRTRSAGESDGRARTS